MRILLIIICLSVCSCTRDPEFHFRSSDSTTGGFMQIALDLNPDQSVKLTRINQRAVIENDSGTVFVPETLSIAGTWALNGEMVECLLKESRQYVNENFFDPKLKTQDVTKDTMNRIVFPLQSDTIYVFGHPCARMRGSKRQ